MKDILPEQIRLWHRLEQAFREVAELYGYGEVRTPLVEATQLFVRQIGEGTDVVDKEMYSFERHGDALTVRPEGTAGAARAYVQHSVYAKEPVTRWYYLGPMFRAERPAKGRYRQFFQAGCEHLGDPGPLCDAEMIHMCSQILEQVGIRDVAIHVNSLGSGDMRERYRAALRDYFLPKREALSDNSQRRLETNPLRILDSKSPADQEVVAGAPSILDLLGPEDAEHFETLRGYLDRLGVQYVVDGRLVRGLDYYTRTLFELKTTSGELGSQDALLGGGRYDGMVHSLGGPKTPAIGFAMGLERILSLMAEPAPASGPDCYLAPMGEPARAELLTLGMKLRERGRRCEVDGRGLSLKAMLRRANAMGSRLCLLLGEDELKAGQLTVKDLSERKQEQVPLEGAAQVIAERWPGAGSTRTDPTVPPSHGTETDDTDG
jgi:histidyl-tRNA synthetase